MIFQLREKELGTVCDVEVFCGGSDTDCIELSSSIFVEGYSTLLIRHLDTLFEGEKGGIFIDKRYS